MRKRKNTSLGFKKGNTLLDGILVLIVMFIFAFSSIIGYYAFDQVKTDMDADADIGEDATNSMSVNSGQYIDVFDKGFLVVFMLMWVFVLIASFMIDSHPIFLVVSLLLLGFILFTGATFANNYAEFTDDTDIVDIADNFPITNYIMDHLLSFILVIGFSIIVALYAKSRYG